MKRAKYFILVFLFCLAVGNIIAREFPVLHSETVPPAVVKEAETPLIRAVREPRSNGSLPSVLLVPVIYFVRNGGGTTVQCTGTTNADYPGTGTGQACAYSNLQNAIDVATWGDTIKLRAGQVFSTSVGFNLPNKGTPPTNTDADYITITSDDFSGTPSALSNYPVSLTRITTAMAANMPVVRTTTGSAVFNAQASSKYWIVERLNITNQDNGEQSVRLITSDGEEAINAVSQYPNKYIWRLLWVHPVEETGTALDSTGNTNTVRTAQNAFYFAGTNIVVRQCAIQGFVGRIKYGGEAGQRITSAGYLVGNYSDTVLLENNLIEAWTYAGFFGGSGIQSWLATQTATVSGCVGNPTTQCNFSNTTGLAVGEPVSVFVSTSTSGNKWGASFVQSIAGSTVTFTAPLCNSFDGGNSCTAQNGTPANGDEARWDGLQPTNITVRQNIFAHYPEWTALKDGRPGRDDTTGDCGGKGYMEIKSCTNCLIKGNTFTGCSGITITVRNQNGDFPWAALDGLMIESNYFKNSNTPFTGYFKDVVPTKQSTGITWTNNLAVGLVTDLHYFNDVQTVVVNATGGTYKLTFAGQQTAAINWNATAGTVQSALEALSNINPGDVAVEGGPGGADTLVARFTGQYYATDVATMIADSSLLTGGTHTATPALAQNGGTVQFFPGSFLSGNFSGGNNVTITHNTIMFSKTSDSALGSPPFNNYRGFLSNVPNPMTGLVIRNNFFGAAPNICFTDLAGTGSTTITSCWPSAVVSNNVFANLDGHDTADLNNAWFTPFPSNTLITSWTTAQFTSPNAKLDAAGNYKLLNTSPYHNAASDGTDIGVNYAALATALGYDPNTGSPVGSTVTICKWGTSPPCITQ